MIFSYLLNMQSHPSWVCGLKLGGTRTDSEKAFRFSHNNSKICGHPLMRWPAGGTHPLQGAFQRRKGTK